MIATGEIRGIAIGISVDRHGSQAQRLGAACNTHDYFTSVRNQQRLHGAVSATT
jgi:hypothetical protein